jgi:hypothetical protein
VDWEQVCQIEKDGIVVTIACQPLRRPRYSIEIGTRVTVDRAGRHFQARVSQDQESGKLSIQRINKEALLECVTLAEQKIMEMVEQDQEDFESSPASDAR